MRLEEVLRRFDRANVAWINLMVGKGDKSSEQTANDWAHASVALLRHTVRLEEKFDLDASKLVRKMHETACMLSLNFDDDAEYFNDVVSMYLEDRDAAFAAARNMPVSVKRWEVFNIISLLEPFTAIGEISRKASSRVFWLLFAINCSVFINISYAGIGDLNSPRGVFIIALIVLLPLNIISGLAYLGNVFNGRSRMGNRSVFKKIKESFRALEYVIATITLLFALLMAAFFITPV